MKSTLRFSPAAHRYRLDGRPVSGVTTLLKQGLPKPALMYWSARTVAEYVIENPERLDELRALGDGPAVAALKAVPWEKRDQAALKGTEIHALGERAVHGESVEVREDQEGHLQGYVEFLERFDVEPILTERHVASRRHWYAGTFDLILRFGRGPWAGRTVLADLKTAKGIYGETGLQTVAYACAEFYVDDDGQERPLPDIDATGAIHITEAGTDFRPLCPDKDVMDQAFRLVQHVFWVAGKIDWIDGLVGEPMVLDEQLQFGEIA